MEPSWDATNRSQKIPRQHSQQLLGPETRGSKLGFLLSGLDFSLELVMKEISKIGVFHGNPEFFVEILTH